MTACPVADCDHEFDDPSNQAALQQHLNGTHDAEWLAWAIVENFHAIAGLIDPVVTAWHRTDPGDDLTGRTRHCWRVEGWEHGEWGQVASASDSIPEAERKRDGVARRAPDLTTRIVRETTTYTVEEAQP